MKKIIIFISLLTGLAIQAVGEKNTVKPPADIKLAALLMHAYAGEDGMLNQEETQKVLEFLKDNLPEPTGRTNLSTSLNRQNVVTSSARGDMTEEREAIRALDAEHYVGKFVKKYDNNKDGALNRMELTNAMTEVIGLPSTSKRWSKRAVASRK